jgi:hypothetical protein
MRKDIFRIVSLSLLAAGMVAAQAQVQPTNAAPAAAGQGAAVAPAPATTTPAEPVLGEAVPAKPLTDAPPAKPKPKAPAKPTYKGKLTALDKTALTLTLDVKGKARTFQITSETRFLKDGKPAVMDAGAVDEMVTVVAKPAKKGKLQVAESVRYGGKAADTKAPPGPKKAVGPKTETKDTGK